MQDISHFEAGHLRTEFTEAEAIAAESEADASFQALPKIDKFRAIVSRHAMQSIDGTLIDVQSANAVITVYDNISPEHQQKFIAMPAYRMATVAWKVVGK